MDVCSAAVIFWRKPLQIVVKLFIHRNLPCLVGEFSRIQTIHLVAEFAKIQTIPGC
jgi:hypothetical protein